MTPTQRKEYMKTYNKQYYIKNKLRELKRNRLWTTNNRERSNAIKREVMKRYKIKHPGKIEESQRRYYLRNKKQIFEKYKARYRSDPSFKLRTRLSNRLNEFINKGGKSTSELLPYTSSEAKEHLEKLFTKKMNWKNHGSYWHIDHKIPLSSAKTREEIVALFALDNLQPLERSENIRKGNRVIAGLFDLDFEVLKEITF